MITIHLSPPKQGEKKHPIKPCKNTIVQGLFSGMLGAQAINKYSKGKDFMVNFDWEILLQLRLFSAELLRIFIY